MAGTIVIVNKAQPRLVAIPNSVILTPCLIKESNVVVSSGTRPPIATTIPVTSLLNLYHEDIVIRAGIMNLSATIARFIRR